MWRVVCSCVNAWRAEGAQRSAEQRSGVEVKCSVWCSIVHSCVVQFRVNVRGVYMCLVHSGVQEKHARHGLQRT